MLRNAAINGLTLFSHLPKASGLNALSSVRKFSSEFSNKKTNINDSILTSIEKQKDIFDSKKNNLILAKRGSLIACIASGPLQFQLVDSLINSPMLCAYALMSTAITSGVAFTLLVHSFDTEKATLFTQSSKTKTDQTRSEDLSSSSNNKNINHDGPGYNSALIDETTEATKMVEAEKSDAWLKFHRPAPINVDYKDDHSSDMDCGGGSP